MDSELSMDGASISEQDTELELPRMVPVSIHSKLPEFQNCKVERVLTGLALSWKEFLQLFDVQLNASDYIIKGSNGVRADLNQTIGQYVDTFRRKQKLYTVNLERVNGMQDEPVKAHKNGVISNNRFASGKKMKLLEYEDKRKRPCRKAANTSRGIMEQIAHSVIKGGQVEQPTTSRRSSGLRGVRKRVKSESLTPIDSDKDFNSDEASRSKLKRRSTNNSSNSARKQRRTRTLSSRRNTKESAQTDLTNGSDDDQESSDSDSEEEPSRARKKLLKEKVIKMLREMVKAKDFVRVRNELMQLRDREKYLKITAVAPITAGFMAECFLRPLPQKEPNRQAE